ncbi:hypothetical protein C8R44DRAFT_877689 [Mycena epipterygia]|nr:hypothetical protein C8R44DRAFT_877689 [Mycena epipterygia]
MSVCRTGAIKPSSSTRTSFTTSVGLWLVSIGHNTGHPPLPTFAPSLQIIEILVHNHPPTLCWTSLTSLTPPFCILPNWASWGACQPPCDRIRKIGKVVELPDEILEQLNRHLSECVSATVELKKTPDDYARTRAALPQLSAKNMLSVLTTASAGTGSK